MWGCGCGICCAAMWRCADGGGRRRLRGRAAAGGAAHFAAAPPGIMFIMGVSTSRKPCMSRKRRTKLMILVRVTKMSRVAARYMHMHMCMHM